ncbi:MAG TPA: type II toxin-antitoxin system VapC family toxin [Xanthobacteraceae bacterium]|jgi:predicted nucleic acid-binding protein|nr:type II toxin-antitoxin system VapC family toxin [Xanthobacteraceae bacterium]
MFLIDTVVLSELRRPQRRPTVVAWFERQRTSDLFLSVISVGEIERGISRQRTLDPSFANALAVWLDRVLSLYGERVLPFDLRTARRWGALSAALGNDSADLMIAATALEHGLTVVTRNGSDFAPTGVAVLDPFQASSRARKSVSTPV